MQLRSATPKQFPTDIMEELKSIATGYANSVICENAHSVIQESCRQSKGSILGRKSKWHRVDASCLLVDNDRAAGIANRKDEAKAAHSKIRPTDFEPKEKEFSLGKEKLDALSDEKVVPAPGLNSYFGASAATMGL